MNKLRNKVVQTDKQVTQSNGFILLYGGYLNPFFMAFGIPAMVTK